MAEQKPRWIQNGGRFGRSTIVRRRLYTVMAGLSVVAGSLWAFVGGLHSKPLSDASTSSHAVSPTEARPVANSHGYLGPQACFACHAERVKEFGATRHFLACVVPSVGNMPEGFQPGRGSSHPRESPVRFEMTEANGKYLQTAIRNSPRGEQRVDATVDLVFGSQAKTDEVYFTWRGNEISELPMSWLHPSREWATAGFDREGSDDFARQTTPRCMECHNTWMDHAPGTVNQYQRETAILGVTCKVCHGPGKAHVTFHETHSAATSAEAISHSGSSRVSV